MSDASVSSDAAADAGAVSQGDAAAPKLPGVSFRARPLSVGTKITFHRQLRRQYVPLKAGVPGTANVADRKIGGTLTLKEVDGTKIKSVEVSFDADSDDDGGYLPPPPNGAKANGAAFYAGKTFIVSQTPHGAEVTNPAGAPAFKDARSIGFVTQTVRRVLPFDTYPSALDKRLDGKTLQVGGLVEELKSYTSGLPFSLTKDASWTLLSMRDGIATFRVTASRSSHGSAVPAPTTAASDAGGPPPPAPPPPWNSSGEEAATLSVPTDTCLWTSVRFRETSQMQSKDNSSNTRTDETMTRTFSFK